MVLIKSNNGTQCDLIY